ncbi:MAG: response regulator transcription factor [Bacteroidetes bacterium]|nr:response regulator transcription factor [Bacteroidota bacterium]
MATILIIEDHPLVREGIRSYLERSSFHKVVGECASGLTGLAKVGELRPDVVLVDLRIPEMDGIEVLRRIRQDYPLIKILVVSMHAGSAYVTRAVRNGAHGYLLKNSDIRDLSQAIDTIMSGGTWFSPTIAAAIDENGRVADPYEDLTTREREVLQLVAEGKTATDIRDILYISARTVEKHRSNLMKKLGLKSHAEVIRYALQRGLIPIIGPG